MDPKFLEHKVSLIEAEDILQFGNKNDGVIEYIGKVNGGLIETGYFFGELKPKNIVTISTQVGCPSKCKFCELGKERFVRSLTSDEMYEQAILMLQIAKKQGHFDPNVKHKITWSKSGDPLLNKNIILGLEQVGKLAASYKISSVFPRSKACKERFRRIADFAAEYNEPVQIQFSLISTNEKYRRETAGIEVATLLEIRDAAKYFRNKNPMGRKINLSLILTDNVPVDVNDVLGILPPELFRFRFRNYVSTENGSSRGLETITNERFNLVYQNFKEAGYDVGLWATPTATEIKHGLAPNVNLERYKNQFS